MTAERRRPRVLIVDDQPSNVRLLAEVLSGSCELFTATSPSRAVELAASAGVDLVLLDVLMPEMDGFHVCRQLKADERTRAVPVIFVTALGEVDDETRGFDAGGVDYITKPISPPIVRARVRTHLELKAARDALEHMASVDGLTGIANRRRFDTVLDDEWRRAARSGEPISVALVDVDHFKAFNDTYGHGRGDACLQAVAESLAAACRRPADVAARYGGEEFALLLPGADGEGTCDRLRTVLDRLEALALPHAGSKCAGHVTVSMGAVTVVPGSEVPPAEALGEADRLLYRAKSAGRRRAFHAMAPGGEPREIEPASPEGPSMLTNALRAVVLSLGVLLAGGAAAQEAAPEAGDEAAELLRILAEETEVATKTRMNSDFVPGIVTVLHGAELEALGFETAWDALSLVPGIHAVRDRDGTPSVIVRGIDFPFNSGNVKVLVNGVPLSRESAGINGIPLQLPVAQVERIEVIRGPGSVVHGEFAYMGLVNVVTRSEGQRGWARADGDGLSAGASLSFHPAAWELTLGAAGWRAADAPVAEPIDADEDRAFAVVQARRGGLSAIAELLARDLDQTAVAPGRPVTGEQTHLAVELRYSREVSPALHVAGRIGYRDNDFDTFNTDFAGDVRDAGIDLSWTGWERHEWLLGASFARSAIDEARFNTPGAPGRPPVALRLADVRRDIFSVVLQDSLDLTDAVTLTAGARLEDHSDLGARVTPRFALVWRASDEHILKAQYSQGFRGPTFFEQYASSPPNPDLDFEVVSTSEVNYVFRRARSVGRVTLFRTRAWDMIYPGPRGPLAFDNGPEARAHGAELEWEQQIDRRVRLIGNLSYSDEEDSRNREGVLQRGLPSVHWMGNAVALVRPTERLTAAVRLHHVGDRGVPVAPEGWTTLDLSLSMDDVFVRGLRARAGVRNVLDDEIRYFFVVPNLTEALPFRGRAFWVQLSWDRP